MDLLENMNAAVDYIENHLDQEINYGEIAKIACFSEHHFKRMFSFIAGISLADYVRRRRLTLAAFDLKEGDMRVIDVAIKYGYNSPDSFSRAFQTLHEVTPSSVKNNEVVPLKAYPRMTFQIAIKGDVKMNYKFVEKESFKVVGFKELVNTDEEGFNPKLWSTMEEDDYNKLHELEDGDTDLKGILNITANACHGEEKKDEDLEYYIAVTSTKNCPEGLSELNIPKQTWVVFDAVGKMPEALTTTWERVYTEWFPTSGYELDEAPEIVKGVDDTKTEIWVPVKKRNN
ncbi:AraC family transcriptional regulator [Virgibacillus salexigens]|uniref:AraC family transcriptional regulator n=1 Tax=Virgibacillus salexigens TaxID=61016 RepID=UPI003081542E